MKWILFYLQSPVYSLKLDVNLTSLLTSQFWLVCVNVCVCVLDVCVCVCVCVCVLDVCEGMCVCLQIGLLPKVTIQVFI